MNELVAGQINFEKYDVTLRDGAQDAQARLSVGKKLEIASILEDFGFDYIEGGWLGANRMDTSFFKRARGSLRLKHAKLVAFGSTAKPNTVIEKDKNLLSLLRSETEVVTVVGKTWEQNVRKTLRVEWLENLKTITESMRFLVGQGREAFFDAEHWFDSYRQNPKYALDALDAALQGGASRLVLCDTRGAANDRFIYEATQSAIARFPTVGFGIHVHNDGDLGTIDPIRALEAGVIHVQGTVNGVGERPGNTNWCSFLPTAEFKYFIKSGLDLTRLTRLSQQVSQINEVPVPLNAPYVGYYAFAHKGGLHVNGQERDPEAYEHIPPEWVGNVRRYFHSEQGGSTNLALMLEKHGFELPRTDDRFKPLVEKMKRYKCFGDAQEFLFLYVHLIGGEMPFTILDCGTESRRGKKPSAYVVVKVNGDIFHIKSTGDGPINAFDRALRKALSKKYPEVNKVKLLDYEVLKQNGDQSSASEVEARLLVSFEGKEITSRVRGTDQDRIGDDAFADIYKYCILKKG